MSLSKRIIALEARRMASEARRLALIARASGLEARRSSLQARLNEETKAHPIPWRRSWRTDEGSRTPAPHAPRAAADQDNRLDSVAVVLVRR